MQSEAQAILERGENVGKVVFTGVRMSKKVKTTLLTLLAMLLWGSIFPCIKVGYKVFKISSAAENSLALPGIRFLVCDIIITVISRAMGQKADKNTKKQHNSDTVDGDFLRLFYVCFYICRTGCYGQFKNGDAQTAQGYCCIYMPCVLFVKRWRLFG